MRGIAQPISGLQEVDDLALAIDPPLARYRNRFAHYLAAGVNWGAEHFCKARSHRFQIDVRCGHRLVLCVEVGARQCARA